MRRPIGGLDSVVAFVLRAGPAVIARGSKRPRFSLSMAISIVPEDSRWDPGAIETAGRGGGGGGVFMLRCCNSGKMGGIAFSIASSMLTVTGEEPKL